MLMKKRNTNGFMILFQSYYLNTVKRELKNRLIIYDYTADQNATNNRRPRRTRAIQATTLKENTGTQ